MPTIIDSLVIQLGIDSSKLDEGQRKAVDKLRELEGATRTHVKQIDNGFGQLINTFKEFQGRLIGIGALIAGGLGLDRLVGDLARVNTQTALLAQSLGQTTEELTKLQAAGRAYGTSPSDIQSGATAIANSYASFSYGQGGPLQRLAGSYPGLAGRLDALRKQYGANAPTSEVLMALSEWATKEERDPNRARYALGQVGLPQGMINMALQGPDILKQRLAEAEQYKTTKDQVDASKELVEKFGNLTNAAEKLAREILAGLAPLGKFLAVITNIVNALSPASGPNAPVVNETPSFFSKTPAGRLWNWLRGKTSGNQQETPPQTNAPATAPAAPTAGASDFLRRERQSFTDQLADPGVRQRVAAMAVTEGAGDPVPVIESLANRMGYVNSERAKRDLPPLTVDQMLNSGFYGPINRGELPGAISRLNRDPALAARMNAAINRVTGGSNTIGGYTDQGLPTDPNGRHTPQMSRGGNVFTDWGGGPGGHAAAAAYRERLMAGVAQENAASSPVTAGFSLPSNGAASRLFDQWRGLNVLTKPAYGSPSTTNNSTSSNTSIGTMNVTVPEGASPQGYAEGIKSHLQRVDPVYQSLTGMN